MKSGVMTSQAQAQPWASPPSVADVDRITALADPVVRNLQITQCYHELSLALGDRTGRSANWCTFAVWASKQVGQTIRKEDLARTLEQLWIMSPEVPAATELPGSTQHQITGSDRPGQFPGSLLQLPGSLLAAGRSVMSWLLLDNPLADLADHRRRIREAVRRASSFERASEATAQGNLKVFQEIAREFARFLATFADDTAFDADKIAVFRAALRPGEPPNGQRYLVQAFTSYHRALFEQDPKTREELVLLGNIAVGLHEQTRLQPEIIDALNAPVVDPRELRRRLLEILLPDPGWIARLRGNLASLIGLRGHVDVLLDQLVEQARLLGRMAVTEHIVTFGLPGGARLKLGQDLLGAFPAALVDLVNTELLALLALVDPTPNSLAGTAVADWSVLLERMHFITDFFRCFQQRPDLLSPPFSPPQVADLKAGRRPEGRL
ncbi:MAG: hypothetical protein ACRDRA_05020 [Pseudonocardiaceae bacterium]